MKRKIAKRVAILALSSVLTAGSLTALAGCGNKNSATTLTVHIFCNESDRQVNAKIIDNWAREYEQSHDLGFTINIDFRPTVKKDVYFEEIKDKLKLGVTGLADVIYLSPRYVRKYSQLGYVADLTPYLSAATKSSFDQIWNNAVSYYGYDGSDDYTFGQSIVYDAASGKFVTNNADATAVGLYGLPKDYSNFSLGFNRQYFSADLVKAYQTHKASETRKVENPSKNNSTLATQYYTGGQVATFAAGGTYYIYDENGVPDLEHPQTAVRGQEAPMLAIGVPVTYKPFNYYIFNDFNTALEAGDPIACLTQGLTRGDGFTVTMPGLPGWTFNIEDAEGYGDKSSAAYKAAVNENAVYDGTIGHNVLTYQEYGALSWAMTYYLNTFNWESTAADGWKEGYGGKTAQEGNTTVHYAIYAGEQYEGADGNALYLLPWLAANDADFINEALTTALNPTGADAAGIKSDENKNRPATAYAGTTTETRDKVNLDGTISKAAVQYGINSQRFLETYAAFANHGAIWNANAGSSKDGHAPDNNSGWNYFQQGRSIFYGAGSWDAATRNDVDIASFNFGQMPAPVSESYALYSTTSTPDYDAGTLKTYSNANNIKATGENARVSDAEQASNASAAVYTPAQIYANQILRQDKWAARMDSVGYAANGRFAKMKEGDKEYWKAEATASLITALTMQEAEQVSLTYAGAQLPNFMQQCTDFLKYQDKDYANYENGAFKDMLTPQGFANNEDYGTEDDIGSKIWNYYYTVAKAMATDSRNSSKNGQTVAQWIAANNYGDYDGTEKGSSTKPLRYDPQYADLLLSEFTGESGTNYFTAMKVLRMVNYTYADRDLNIRMQTGLNSVRDSTMFTPEADWLASLDARTQANSTMLSYYANITVASAKISDLQAVTENAIARMYSRTADASTATASEWWSPAYYASYYGIRCDNALKTLILQEKEEIGR